MWRVPIAILFLNVLVLATTTAYLIYSDARLRGSDAAGSTAILGAVFLPAAVSYVLRRKAVGSRNASAARGERIAGTIWVASATSFVSGVTLSPPDPATTGYYVLALFAPGLLAGYLLVGRNGWSSER